MKTKRENRSVSGSWEEAACWIFLENADSLQSLVEVSVFQLSEI